MLMLTVAAGMSPREVRIRHDDGSGHFLVHQADEIGEDFPVATDHEKG